MSTTFVACLIGAVVLILASRVVIGALPLRRISARATEVDVGLVGLGILGLTFHCTAMFFRSTAGAIPGTETAIRTIVAMGTGSVVWYVAPAVLLLLGLRRQHPAALALMTAASCVVGITMYDRGPVPLHLAAIFTSVVIVAGILATLVVPPWQKAPAPTYR